MGRRLPGDWFDADLPPNVIIGEGSWVFSSHVFIHCASTRPCAVRIGRNTGAYIGTMFDLGKDAEVVVGDHCTLAGVVIATDGRVDIGDRTLMSFGVVVADTGCSLPPDGRSRRRLPALGGRCGAPIVIGDDAWVGARSTILGGVRVGASAVIGAGTLVDADVPDGAVAVGNPMRIVRRPSRP